MLPTHLYKHVLIQIMSCCLSLYPLSPSQRYNFMFLLLCVCVCESVCECVCVWVYVCVGSDLKPQHGRVRRRSRASSTLRGSRVKTYRKASTHKKKPNVISCKSYTQIHQSQTIIFSVNNIVSKDHIHPLLKMCNFERSTSIFTR